MNCFSHPRFFRCSVENQNRLLKVLKWHLFGILVPMESIKRSSNIFENNKQPIKLTVFLNLEVNPSHSRTWYSLHTKFQTRAYFGILMVELQPPRNRDSLCTMRTAAQELQRIGLNKVGVYLSLTRKSVAQ